MILILLLTLLSSSLAGTDLTSRRIAFGTVQNEYTFPYASQVIVQIFANNCTGTIIGKRFVLTSSKCIQNSDGVQVNPDFISILYGSTNNRPLLKAEANAAATNVQGIAIIQTKTNFNISDNLIVGKIHWTIEDNIPSENVFTCGWGKDELRQLVEQLHCTKFRAIEHTISDPDHIWHAFGDTMSNDVLPDENLRLFRSPCEVGSQV